jgi:hypothetical protein
MSALTASAFAMTTVIAKFLDQELYKQFVKELKIGYRTWAKSRIISNRVVLQLMLFGDDRDKIEVAIEMFLKRMHDKLVKFTPADLELFKKKALLQLGKDYDSVKQFAEEDTEILYLTNGVNYDLRRNSGDILKNDKIDLNQFQLFLQVTLFQAKRIVFEYSDKVDTLTNLKKDMTYGSKEIKIKKHYY